MNRQALILIALVAAMAVVLVLLRPTRPDFSALPADGQRQSAFAVHLCPAIERQNARVRADRALVNQLSDCAGHNAGRCNRLAGLGERYGLSTDVPTPILVERLRSRVDELPPALVLAQAALESGWGTSEIAVEAGNYFGRRCFYVDDCYELSGSSGEVTRYRRFDDIDAAVALYFRDLNILLPYRQLRALRTSHGQNAERIAHGLMAYSSRGSSYVRQVVTLMERNNLTDACSEAR